MRQRALRFIGCPSCYGQLNAQVIEQAQMPVPETLRARVAASGGEPAEFTTEVKEGFLLCPTCRYLYPVFNHVPRLFCYITAAGRAFLARHAATVAKLRGEGFTTPDHLPEPGEASVQRSFTSEWGDYDYDGIIWDLSYEERLRLCVREIGLAPESLAGKTLADIGCGIGVLTNSLVTHRGVEAVGVDLSDAVLRAARQYLSNPLLHFAQGSVFHLPLRKRHFDVGYSSGVLHHTYDTRRAFQSAAQVTKPGGRFYVWLYSAERSGVQGAISIGNNLVRAAVCRMPRALQDASVYGLTLLFWGARALLRSRLYGGKTTTYNWKQALHAARDIYTPRYAHHHTRAEVTSWFREAGFVGIEALASERSEKVTSIPVSVRGEFRGAVVPDSLPLVRQAAS